MRKRLEPEPISFKPFKTEVDVVEHQAVEFEVCADSLEVGRWKAST